MEDKFEFGKQLPHTVHKHYYEFRLIGYDGPNHLLLKARSRLSHQVHVIKVLNTLLFSERQSLDKAKEVFAKECLFLCSKNPSTVFIQTFKEVDDKLAFATRPMQLTNKQNDIVSEKTGNSTNNSGDSFDSQSKKKKEDPNSLDRSVFETTQGIIQLNLQNIEPAIDEISRKIIRARPQDFKTQDFVACCTARTNHIEIYNLQTKKPYSDFDGSQMIGDSGRYMHLKEIPDSDLLISANHGCLGKNAKLEILKVSGKKPEKLFSFGLSNEYFGFGDIAYSEARNMIAGMPLKKKTSYHLFTIDKYYDEKHRVASLLRKTRWCPEHNDVIENLDFDSEGERIATIDIDGVLVASDVTSNSHIICHRLRGRSDSYVRCRWSPKQSKIYVKYDFNKFNVLDLEKSVLSARNPQQLQDDTNSSLYCLDANQSDSNLVALAGVERNISIFDIRQGKVAKAINHPRYINNLRWSLNGKTIATAFDDGGIRVYDFATENMIYQHTNTANKYVSVCFLSNLL